MATYTDNLNLKKPAQEDQYNVDDFNDNFDKIDDFAGLTPPRALTADKLTTGAKINGINFKGDTDIITGLGLYDDGNIYNNTNLVYLYDTYGKLRIFQSLQNSNIAHSPISSPTYWREIQIGAKRNYGEIVTSSLPIANDDSIHLADGSLLSATNYPDLLTYIDDLYSSLPTGEFSVATQSATLGNNNWTGVAYGDGKFVAINKNGYYSTSTDGNTWTTPVFMGSTYQQEVWSGLTYDGSRFVAFGQGNIYTSTNGTTWTQETPDQSKPAASRNIVYGNGIYIAMDSLMGWAMEISTDRTIWTEVSDPTDRTIINAVFDGNKFIGVGYTDGKIYESTNGTNWTLKSTIFPGSSSEYIIGFDGQQYIVINPFGHIAISSDLVNWDVYTTTNLGSNDWRAITTAGEKTLVISETGYISTKEDPFTNVFTTEANWQSSVSTYGECGKYVYNSTNHTLRIPMLNSYLTNTTNPKKLGDLTPASAPNLKGTFPASENIYKSGTPTPNYGVFQLDTSNVVSGKSSNTDFDNDLWNFNANRASSVYSDEATTINTQSIKQLVYIVVKV